VHEPLGSKGITPEKKFGWLPERGSREEGTCGSEEEISVGRKLETAVSGYQLVSTANVCDGELLW
jgi:hypothetical protein